LSSDEADLDLRSLTTTLRRYGGRIVAVTVVAGAAGFFLAKNSTAEYSATAYVEIVDPGQDVVALTSKNVFDIEAQRQAVRVLLESPEVHDAVAAKLGPAVKDPVSISTVVSPDTALVGVRAKSRSAVTAQQMANVAVQAATDVQRERIGKEFQAVADQLKADGQALDDRIREFDGRITALDQAAAQAGIAAVVAPGAAPTPAQVESGLVAKQQADEAAVARQQRATVFEQQLELERQAQQYELEAVVRSPGFRAYRDAELPPLSSGSHAIQSALLAAAAGFAMALGISYVVAYADGRVRRGTVAEADRLGLNLLATLPPPGVPATNSALQATDETRRAVPPARQSLALTLRYGAGRDTPAVLCVVGPRSSDRCNGLVQDLAVTLARSGLRVVVVDADLRRAAGGPGGGFGAVLAGDRVIETELVEIPTGGSGSLALLPAGGLGLDPVPLMGSSRVGRVVEELRNGADCVVMDFPPALEAAEALALAQHVDDVVITADVGTTRRKDIIAVKDSLVAVGAQVLGLVLVDGGSSRHLGAKKNRAAPPLPESRKPSTAAGNQATRSRARLVTPVGAADAAIPVTLGRLVIAADVTERDVESPAKMARVDVGRAAHTREPRVADPTRRPAE
jgi:uncharacterized protein involved in exopolysaccharide biosynthesis